MSAPEVSVVIPAYYSDRTLGECLAALEAQTFQDFEVVVVDSTPGKEAASAVCGRFPRVVFHHHPHRLLPHQARNVGAGLTSGHILVFTDPDCTAKPDWLDLLVASHRHGHEAAGGAVACGSGWWRLAVHFTKYAWWLPGGQPQPRPEIPSANSSFSRELWERTGPYLGERFAGDSELSWRVRAAGTVIWFEPRAVVTHSDSPSFSGFLRERYQRGRDFGLLRRQKRHWRRWRFLLYLGLLPALPLLMTFRAGRYAASGSNLRKWLLTLPVQIPGNAAWCLGEAAIHCRGLLGR